MVRAVAGGVALVLSLGPVAVLGAPSAPAAPLVSVGTVADERRVARAETPVYREPASYRGRRTEPPVREVAQAPVLLSTAGRFPDAYVDEAGTAHVVWTEGRGDAADVAVYCRLERAADRCDTSTVLTWEKSYGTGDAPRFNSDDVGPRIVRVGDTLLVLSYRYPTVSEKPDGLSGHTLVGWVSQDGGDTWDPAGGRILGDRTLGPVAVVGTGEDPLVATLAQDPLCGGSCLTTIRSGSYETAEGVLNPDPDADYHQGLVADDGDLVAAMSDAGVGAGSDPWSIWLRRWNGAEPVTDPARWTTSDPVAGTAPTLAAGGAGVFLAHEGWNPQGFTEGIVLREVRESAGVPQPGPGTTVAGAAQGNSPVLAVDEGGAGLHLAWTDRDGSIRLASTLTSGESPTDLDRPRVLADRPGTGAGPGQVALASTADGGGFALFSRDGGVNAEGAVVAQGFGTPAPTGRLGLGDLPGGGNVSCSAVDFGSFELEAQQACLLRGTGNAQGLVVSRGPLELNGLELVPDPGTSLVIDPERLRLDSTGPVSVLLRNGRASIELFRGELHRDLSGLAPGSTLFEFPHELFVPDILGFPAAAGVPVQLTQDGVRVPLELALPAPLDVVTGKAVLLGSRVSGLEIESLDAALGPIPLGVLTLEAALSWTSGGTWKGDGSLEVPAGGSFAAQVTFEGGQFAGAAFDYRPTPPLAVGPFVFLTQVGGGLSLRPDVEITARVGLGTPLPLGDVYPVEALGQFTMTFPTDGPARFRLDGNLELFMIRVAGGYVEAYTDGYARFHGDAGLDLGPLRGSAVMDGFVDPASGTFGADLDGELELCVVLKAGLLEERFCAGVGGRAAISSNGFAACARFNPPDPFGGVTAGLETRWDELSPAALANPVVATKELLEAIAIPCDTEGYSIPPPARSRDAARAARAVDGVATGVEPGLPSVTFLVSGEGGAPDVRLTGPGGEELAGPSGTAEGVDVVGVEGSDATWVVVHDPAAGDYLVEAAPGSVPIREVLTSRGLVPAQVDGTVRRGEITYRTTGLGRGQSLVLREEGDFGVSEIATTTEPRGTIRFRPAPAAGGERLVRALVLDADGLVLDEVVLGAYTAPEPRGPGRVGRVRGVLKGSALRLRLPDVARATRLDVQARGDAGDRAGVSVPDGTRKVTLGGFAWDRVVTVTVRAHDAQGRASTVRTVVVRR